MLEALKGPGCHRETAADTESPGDVLMDHLSQVFKGEASLVAQIVKRLPTTRETWVRSLGWEDLLEKAMAPHSSILAWKIPWTEEPGRLRVGHN